MMKGFILILSILAFLTSCQVKSPELMQGESVAVINNPGNFNVVVSNDGWKKLGDKIEVTLLFPYELTVTGTPYIKATFESENSSTQYRFLTYDALSSSSQLLKFSYTVGVGDEDTDGIELDNFIELNGGQITYFLNGVLTDCPLALNYPAFNIKVDGIVPTVTQIFKPVTGNYITGQNLNYSLNFSEKVFVQPTASFNLQIGSSTSTAVYSSGSGTETIIFQKAISAANSDSDGITNSSSFNNSSLLKDIAGNAVVNFIPPDSYTLYHLIPEPRPEVSLLPLPSIYSSWVTPIIYVNLAVPTITSVVAPASGTYTNGQNLDFIVNFNSAVKVSTTTGVPAIKLNLSSGTKFAYYLSGSGTTQLTFRHTVGINQLATPLGMDYQIQLFGGTIKNIAETVNASLTFSPPTVSGISMNTMQNSYVTEIIYPSNGTYKAGDIIYFTLVFNRVINVNTSGGIPSIKIPLNSGNINPDYDSGSGTNQIRFKYTVLNADYEPDGIFIDPTINLNGGTMIDYLGSAIYTTMGSGLNAGVKIDAVLPQIVTPLTSPIAGTYAKGDTLELKINFNKNVYVTGSPTLSLSLSTSATTVQASYVSGSGTSQLTFKYTIVTGDLDTDGIAITALNLISGSTIKDIFGADATVTFSASTFASVKVDAVAPSLTSVGGNSSGTLSLGNQLSFGLSFNDAVIVIGSPRLKLTIDNTVVYATYHSMASPTQIIFKYFVQANLLDTDGVTLDPYLDFNGGHIQDSYGNAVPEPLLLSGAPSLAGLYIDSTGSEVTSISTTSCSGAGINKNGKIIDIKFTFNENVYKIYGTPQIPVMAANKIYMADYLSGSGTNNITFRHVVQDDELDLDGISIVSPINLNGGTLVDNYNNLVQLNFSGVSLPNCKVDGIIPKVEAFYPPADDVYGDGEFLYFRVVWSENINVNSLVTLPQIKFTIGSTDVYADHYSTVETSNPFIDPVMGNFQGRVSIFRYQVTTSDEDTDGISINNTVQNGTGIKDIALNPAILTLSTSSPLPAPGVIIDGKKPTITLVDVDSSSNIYYPRYKAGTTIDVRLTFSENVYVVGAPQIDLQMGSATPVNIKKLNYAYGSGTNVLHFTYEVQNGINVSGLQLHEPVILNGGSIKDQAGNNANLDFATLTNAQGIDYFPLNLIIDTTSPTFTNSVTTANQTEPTKNNSFFPNHEMIFTAIYSEAVTVSGVPQIELTIGSETRYATYTTLGSTATSLKFIFQVDAGDILLDLDGISVNNSIQLSGGNIIDLAGNVAQLTFNYPDKDYVYITGFNQRYNISTGSYTTSSGVFISTMKNLTQEDGRLMSIPSTSKPTVSTSGFGSNNKGYIDFSSDSALQFADLEPTTSLALGKTIIVVMKTHSSLSGNHVLFQAFDDPAGGTAILDNILEFNGTGINTGSTFSPKMMLNSAPLTTGYSPFTNSLQPSTNYILILRASSSFSYYDGSVLGSDCNTITSVNCDWGGNYFTGKVAEFIILDTEPSSSSLELIRDQLNSMYGVY